MSVEVISVWRALSFIRLALKFVHRAYVSSKFQ